MLVGKTLDKTHCEGEKQNGMNSKTCKITSGWPCKSEFRKLSLKYDWLFIK